MTVTISPHSQGIHSEFSAQQGRNRLQHHCVSYYGATVLSYMTWLSTTHQLNMLQGNRLQHHCVSYCGDRVLSYMTWLSTTHQLNMLQGNRLQHHCVNLLWWHSPYLHNDMAVNNKPAKHATGIQANPCTQLAKPDIFSCPTEGLLHSVRKMSSMNNMTLVEKPKRERGRGREREREREREHTAQN